MQLESVMYEQIPVGQCRTSPDCVQVLPGTKQNCTLARTVEESG